MCGFFIDHEILNEIEGYVDVQFTLKADYETKPVVLFGSYSVNNRIIRHPNSFHSSYNKFHDLHYKQVLKNGFAKINVDLKEGTVEIEIKN